MKADGFSELLGLIYEGPLEASPWQSFLAEIREQLGAHTVTLLLRPPRSEGHNVMLSDGGSLTAIESYNEEQFALDPFVNLESGEVISLHEFMTTEALLASDFYKVVMEPQRWYDFLGADLRDGSEMDARFRVGRYQGAKKFGKREKNLVQALLPHLARAIRLHSRLHRSEKERALYAGAIDQLAVAAIILDESGRVLSRNKRAEELLAEADGIGMQGPSLQLTSREANRELQTMIEAALRPAIDRDAVAVEALRVPRSSQRADLGLVIRKVPETSAVEGQAMPSVVVFISDPERVSETPVDVITRLFGFTPTEARLAMMLAQGLNLDEASTELTVSRNTTRTHLRALFSKTGVTRQSLLVRLILSSVAPLA